MQTDLQRFVALYESFGVTCIVNRYGVEYQIVLSAEDYPDAESTYSDKLNGYRGFYTRVLFDGDGKFASQGFWE